LITLFAWSNTRYIAHSRIGEGDIRDSLLKGALRNKLIAGEIEIVDSDIHLIQFNEEQKVFLQEAVSSKDWKSDQIN